MTERLTLLCMRLKDMTRVHPHQVTMRCSICRKKIGVYPSGQRVMKDHPNIKPVCQVCRPAADVHLLAPGAELEPFESYRKGGDA